MSRLKCSHQSDRGNKAWKLDDKEIMVVYAEVKLGLSDINMNIISNSPRMRYFTRVYTICEDKIDFQKTIRFVLRNLNHDPSVYKMDHSDFKVSNYG